MNNVKVANKISALSLFSTGSKYSTNVMSTIDIHEMNTRDDHAWGLYKKGFATLYLFQEVNQL